MNSFVIVFHVSHCGRFLKNFSGHNTPINALAVNEDGVAVSCGDNGTIDFWDYETGYCFQKSSTIAQPGSLDAECGIYAAGFDLSGRYEKQISKQASDISSILRVRALCHYQTFSPFLPCAFLSFRFNNSL